MSIDLSLDRINRLVSYLPPFTRPTVHIAGTNGKGSVAALISSILFSSSLSVGRYNSPHLVSIHDCITINNIPVSFPVYESTREKVIQADTAHNTQLSNFELLTLTAFCIFEDAKVDIAVVEVGMGGRLDATNIIADQTIAVSLLTAVDLDHQAFLGNTVGAIAREKAGIARPSRPFVLGPQPHDEVVQTVREVISTVNAKLIIAPRAELRKWDHHIDGQAPTHPFRIVAGTVLAPQPVTVDVPSLGPPIPALLPLIGKHQLDNLGTAVAGINAMIAQSRSIPSIQHLDLVHRITPKTLAEGICRTNWQGRLSFHTVPISTTRSRPLTALADGAHNPAAAVALASFIERLLADQSESLRLTYVLGLSHSPPKTPRQTLGALLLQYADPDKRKFDLRVACIDFTPPQGMPWVRAVPPAELATVVRELVPEAQVWIPPDLQEARCQPMESALEWVASSSLGVEKDAQELVVVAGSLYVVADLYRILQATEDAQRG